MNAFCSYIEEEIRKKFSIPTNCFLSEKKKIACMF